MSTFILTKKTYLKVKFVIWSNIMLKIFTFLALIIFSLNANENIQVNCDEIYDQCVANCEEKTPDDENCFTKCQIVFDDCIANEEKEEETSKNFN